MSAGPCTVILASAGTGKTWQLTTRYLALVARGERPERILASTFTRKAAAEILDRIFQRVAKAASSDEGAAELARHLALPDLTRAAALELATKLARGIQRFQVSTLDAFFVRMAQALALELGLAPDWTLLDEQDEERLRAAAISAVLARGDREEWAVLLRQLHRGASSRSAHEALMRAVRECSGCFADSAEAAWSTIQPPEPLALEQIAAALGALEGAVLPRNKKGDVNGHWKKAHLQSLQSARRGDWAGFLKSGLPSKILECTGEYHGIAIDDDLDERFAPLMHQARAELGRRLLEQSRATWRVCSDFQRAYESRRGARGGVRFDLLPRLLARRLSGPERVATLAELEARLDTHLDHVLLDEFQDTSPAQWKVLAPFAEELCGGGERQRSFFCVGDPKQSIYAWREAEPQLLIDLPSRLPGAKVEALNENYRSSPVVLDAVDMVFGSLASNPALAPQDRALEREVASKFAWHAPVAAKSELPGVVVLRTSVAAPRTRRPKPTWILAAERAVQLHREAPERSIAILVRRKVPIPSILNALLASGVRASGEGGNALTDSAAVNVALSAIQLADHPGDSALRFHVASSPLAAELGLEPPASAVDAAAWASERRRELLEHGYARFLQRLRPRVASEYGSWDRSRFDQLALLALDCERSLGLRPSEFVARVESQRVEDPTASSVRVMTIHAAKGLEFDAVLLPELDLRLGGAVQPAVVAGRPGIDPLVPYDRVSRYPDEMLRRLYPELGLLRDEAQRRRVMEELCILYVAMTRAVHHLELIVAPREKAELPCTFEGLLRGALPLASEEPEAVLWRHEASDERWRAPKESTRSRAAPSARDASGPIRLAVPRRARELARSSPSALAHPRRIALAQLVAPDSAALLRGRRLHAWLERVGWLEDGVPTDSELAEVARAHGIGEGELEVDLARFREMLARPQLAALLSRAASARRLATSQGELVLWRERRFAVLDHDGGAARLLHGAFDRAVLAREGGAFARAELCDFKSDRLGGDAARLAERAAHYRPQLAAYGRALARIAALAPERVALQIAFVEEDRVVRT